MELATGVTLYPNPATTKVKITAREDIKGISICTLNGKEIFRKTGINRSDDLLQIGMLPQGLYYVKVETRSKTSNTLLYKTG